MLKLQEFRKNFVQLVHFLFSCKLEHLLHHFGFRKRLFDSACGDIWWPALRIREPLGTSPLQFVIQFCALDSAQIACSRLLFGSSALLLYYLTNSERGRLGTPPVLL